MSVLTITEENFAKEVLNSEKKVIVDFYADWCMPCKMMSPIIDEIADEMGSNIVVCKANSDSNMNLLAKYGIMSIPTIMIFKNGQVINTFVGVTSKEKIIDAINN